MIPILILAAGTSSRMRGSDKMLENVDGVPLLRRQAKMAIATGHPVFVAVAPQKPERVAALHGLDVTTLIVPEASEGLSGTLRGAIGRLPDCEAFMIMLGDLVALTTLDLETLVRTRANNPDFLVWRGATDDNKPGHPILLDQCLRAEFVALQGDHGGETVLRRHREKSFLVAFKDQRARFDLDTPEDWAAWRAIYP